MLVGKLNVLFSPQPDFSIEVLGGKDRMYALRAVIGFSLVIRYLACTDEPIATCVGRIVLGFTVIVNGKIYGFLACVDEVFVAKARTGLKKITHAKMQKMKVVRCIIITLKKPIEFNITAIA